MGNGVACFIHKAIGLTVCNVSVIVVEQRVYDCKQKALPYFVIKRPRHHKECTCLRLLAGTNGQDIPGVWRKWCLQLLISEGPQGLMTSFNVPEGNLQSTDATVHVMTKARSDCVPTANF